MVYSNIGVRRSGRDYRGLREAIAELENQSFIFQVRYRNGQLELADGAAHAAMAAIDHIVGEITRKRDLSKVDGKVADDRLKEVLALNIGKMVDSRDDAEHERIVLVGPGNAHLPSRTVHDLPFDRTLMKIKHRHSDYINFRIENGRHIFVFCPRFNDGNPDCIAEIDVLEFCQQCRTALGYLEAP